MTITKITIVSALVLTAGSVGSGIVLHAMGELPRRASFGEVTADDTQPSPAQKNDEAGQEAGIKARAKSLNNLKLIAVAMHSFVESNDQSRFPPAAIRRNGKPLLSWRVAILPFLDQEALYHRFHLNEPWDSPHNKILLNQMPEVYAPVVRTDEPRGSTYYQLFTGPGALFEDERGPSLKDISDGTSSTLLVAEAGSPVPWTKPEDILFDKDKPLPKLGRQFNDGFHVAFADASARFLGKEIDPETLRALITSSGEEVVNFDKL
jgi:hypothetical protein